MTDDAAPLPPQTLRQRVWVGEIDDPQETVRQVMQGVDPADYGSFLTQARAAIQLGLQVPLEPALSRHPTSIDLALLALDQAAPGADTDAALTRLRGIVEQQNRRRAAFAWAAWTRQRPALALSVFDTPTPGSATAQADARARDELRILAGHDLDPAALSPRLALLRLWRRDGGAALWRHVQPQIASLPADPALWSWLVEVLITERDLPAARSVAQHAGVRLSSRQKAASRAVLALEADDPDAALMALGPLIEGPPWDWSAQAHALWLRARLLAKAQARETPDDLHDHARAACRLFPRHGHLAWIEAEIALRSGDWTTLDPHRHDPWAEMRIRQAMGDFDGALECLTTIDAGTPDMCHRVRIKRAELTLRNGRPQQAQMLLGPPPGADMPWPHRADDAYWRAEIALALRDQGEASRVLGAIPNDTTRMGIWLQRARLGFLNGDSKGAQDALARFNSLKADQLGAEAPLDLRDRIIADLAQHGDDPAHPAGAARALAIPPRFLPAPDAAIPRQLWHYWQGPVPSAVTRGVAAWRDWHPGWAQSVLNAESGREFLIKNAAHMIDLFDHFDHPALRADLIRVALLTHHGGVFADLDEYPRMPIEPWIRDASCVLVIEEGFGTVANNFMASEPQNPVMATLLHRIERQLRATDTPYPWWDTGPAQVTVAAQAQRGMRGLRLLSQAKYDRRIATNLPYPHKSGPDHWR